MNAERSSHQPSASPRNLFNFFSSNGSSRRLMNRIRPDRPNSSPADRAQMFGNIQGNRIVHSVKTFETQGIILPVHFIRSSLAAVKVADGEIEICGKFDSKVPCRIEISSNDAWKHQTFNNENVLPAGLGQEFSIRVPAFSSFGPKVAELRIFEVDAESRMNRLNRGEKFANPFYLNQEFITMTLCLRENGMYELKVEDQFIKLRNKNFSLLEIFGKPTAAMKSTASSPTSYCSDGLNNRECIICMSEVKDTIVLPCRHMCLCYDCANTIRNRSDRCPLCRQGIAVDAFNRF